MIYEPAYERDRNPWKSPGRRWRRAIFQRCDCRLTGPPTVYNNVDDAWRDLSDEPKDRTKVKKLAYFDDGWTFIVDDEIVMLVQDEVWSYVSEHWQTRVFGWICEGASGTYAIAVFDNGKKIRNAFYVDGELHEDNGSPLPEESGVDSSSPYEDDILRIADRMGASFGCSDFASAKHVYLLDESHMEV